MREHFYLWAAGPATSYQRGGFTQSPEISARFLDHVNMKYLVGLLCTHLGKVLLYIKIMTYLYIYWQADDRLW